MGFAFSALVYGVVAFLLVRGSGWFLSLLLAHFLGSSLRIQGKDWPLTRRRKQQIGKKVKMKN
jgi:hypothetical protein